tara:strand:- start:70 stop:474 length:405 start_codon:yes stop_codon:yes gene_type:complete
MFLILVSSFKKNKLQILRFILSGLIATSINFIVFNSLYLILKNILIASLTGYFSGLATSFTFAKVWVFRGKSNQRFIKSFSIFCLIYFLGGLEMTLITILLNQLVNNYKLAWFIGASIGALNNYLGSKLFLFKE